MKTDLIMSMYKGSYGFEFIGAVVRWSFLVLFPKYRNQKGLFKKVLTGGVNLGERSSEVFVLNLLIGLITIVLAFITAIYIKSVI
ncbi:hypothetical protein GCM10009122_07120 [Fulvivirga kasyanovii]